jgi:hypothetical protein
VNSCAFFSFQKNQYYNADNVSRGAAGLQVRDTCSPRGNGAYAKEPIPAGAHLGEYQGELLGLQEFYERYPAGMVRILDFFIVHQDYRVYLVQNLLPAHIARKKAAKCARVVSPVVAALPCCVGKVYFCKENGVLLRAAV